MRVGEPEVEGDERELLLLVQSVFGVRERAGVHGASLGQALANDQLQAFRKDRMVLDDQDLQHIATSRPIPLWLIKRARQTGRSDEAAVQ